MKFYPNAINALTGAVTTALNPLASASIDRAIVARTGGGIIGPSGAYTGQTDGVFDVEIRNDTITGTPRVSAPIFEGVGNPTMFGISAAAGVAAQSFTVTLADLGSDTTKAYTPFQGRTLRAKTAGADANYIEITVSDSGLTRTATNAALLSDLIAGTNEYVGREWDFGGPPRNPDGSIPASAPRLSFGDDPQVYRQYKVYANGGYVYSFTPAPVRTVAKDAPVKAVTGGRTVVVTHTLGAAAPAFIASTVYTLGQRVKPITPNGHWYEVTVAGTSAGSEPTWPTNGGTVVSNTVTFIDRGVHTNTYSSIVTLFDALTAIQGDADSLIEVVEPIVNDLQFGGMGITDLSVQTGAFVQSIVRDGSDSVRSSALSVTAAADAPTEEIVIKCISAGTPNAEIWEVRGSVSGLQPSMVTGVPYDEGIFASTIPLLPVPEVAPTTSRSAKLTAASETKPVLCEKQFILGANAQPKTLTFKWELREDDCDCENVDIGGNPNPIFLGIDPEVLPTLDTLHADLKTRVQACNDWASTFIKSNTLLAAAAASEPIESTAGDPDRTTLNQTYSAIMTADVMDNAAVMYGRNLFCNTLFAMQEHYGEDTIPTDATDLWDDLFADLQTDFADLEADNAGGAFWNDVKVQVLDAGTGASMVDKVVLNRRIFTDQFSAYMERYRIQMDRVYIAADLKPPSFDSSTGLGTGPWTDRGGDGWWVSQDGYAPFFDGYGNYLCRAITGEDGTVTYVSTLEAYFAFGIGCKDRLSVGDTLTLIIGETGTSTIGYQMGDRFILQDVAGGPAQFGGGQIGTDTLTWSVVSSLFGAMPNYLYYKPTPQNYTDGTTTFAVLTAYALGARVTPIGGNGHWYRVTIAGTSGATSPAWPTNGTTVVSGTATFQDLGPYVDFEILEGGIASRLGDRFVWFAEGGQFRWRKNAGSWSADTQIAATVVLSDGVSAAFTPGAAPSFVAGDTYQFTAHAINGGEHLQSLTYGGITTTRFEEVPADGIWKHRIQAIPAVAKTASHALILFSDETQVGATVTLRGFATSGAAEGAAVFSVSVLTNGSRCLLIPSAYTTACAKWTITYYATANTPANLGWLWCWIGNPLEMVVARGTNRNLGTTDMRWLLPSRGSRRSDIAAQVEFTGVKPQSAEDFRYALEYAARNDDARMGITVGEAVAAPSFGLDAFGAALTAYTEAGIVAYEDDSLRVRDVFGHEPTDTSQRVLEFTLELTAVP